MTKQSYATIALLALISVNGLGLGQETITLTTPDSVPANLRYHVERLTLEWDDPGTGGIDEGRMLIQLLGIERPVAVACIYSDMTKPTATTLINGLNKANLSTAYAATATTGSLKQRIYHRLVVMNEAGTVCGRSLAGSLTGTVP